MNGSGEGVVVTMRMGAILIHNRRHATRNVVEEGKKYKTREVESDRGLGKGTSNVKRDGLETSK
jgi:hypothetical protein